MSLMRINPLRDLKEVSNLMNRFFDTGRGWGEDRALTSGNWAPLADIHETENELVFTFEVPGFEKDQLNITVHEGRLVLSGERAVEEPKDLKYHHVERWRGSFYRTFLLPTSVNSEAIQAQLKNGILTVTLPKRAEAKPRQIEVSVQ
jgi:HSP20 family protein